MATWNITVNAQSNISAAGTQTISGSIPGDFDGATITDVSVSGSPSITPNAGTGPTNDDIGVRFAIETSGGGQTWGSVTSDAVSLCWARLVGTVSSATIVDGSGQSPQDTPAVAADWDQLEWAIDYSASGKNDGETIDWASFTIVVTYTPSAAGLSIPVAMNGYKRRYSCF